MAGPGIPLAPAADAMLARLARATGSAAIAALDGATLLGERAMLMGLGVPGRVSAGGGCRLIAARDDMIALNLARPADRELLPALFADATLDPDDDAAIDARTARADATTLVERGRLLGLPIAAFGERHDAPVPFRHLITGTAREQPSRKPRVVDLSALWAGPLASHLLWLAGAEVIKVESRTRPDRMREGQPDFYALLNQGKAGVALDLHDAADRDALLGLIAGADIVIEAARPRALAQLGIHADAIVRATPGLVWLTITAHGATGDAAGWVGFGDDVGIAAGLGAAMHAATGTERFTGDAIADPLTGLHAAAIGWEAWQAGGGTRIAIAMRDVVALCLQAERSRDGAGLDRTLVDWAAAEGQPFPPVTRRPATAPAAFASGRPIWSG